MKDVTYFKMPIILKNVSGIDGFVGEFDIPKDIEHKDIEHKERNW
mgnify:CR=1 FL=1